MLPKQARLKRPIRTTQYSGHTPHLSFRAKDNGLTLSRFLVVTGKSLGNAVVRNRLRRVLVTSFADICHKLGKKCDIVVYPKPTMIGLGLVEAKSKLSQLLERMK